MSEKKKQVLIVDDNERYSKALGALFEQKIFAVHKSISAKDACAVIEEKGLAYFDILLTDITMERQLAGLSLLRKLQKKSFPGIVIVASTGFDFPGITKLSCISLTLLGAHYIIPKKSIRQGKPLFYPTGLNPLTFGAPMEFKEIFL